MAQKRNIIAKDFFIYPTAHLSVTAGANDTQNIRIQSDSDFFLQKLSMFADVAAAGQTSSSQVLPLATVQITDTGAGRDLMADAVPIPALFGTGELPFILPNPKVFVANTTVKVSVTNFDTSQTYNIRLAFIGQKLFSG